MADSREIEPAKVYVRFIPLHTTFEEVGAFFSACGKVTFVSLLPPKTSPFTFYSGFVSYETQQEADCAIQKLHRKHFINEKGFAGQLSVMAARIMNGKKNLDNANEQQLNELRHTYEENEEKLKQIYYDPAVEQELQDLKMRLNQLEVQVDELKGKVHSLKGSNEILHLKLQIQELDDEQRELKAQH